MQISCWAETYTGRETLKDAVETALKFYTGTSKGVNIEITWPVGPYAHVKDVTGFSFIPYDFKINYYTT
jgi:hypothetical protein